MERERVLLNAIAEGTTLSLKCVGDCVGKTVDICDKTSGRRFAGRVESAEFAPAHVGADKLYFIIAGVRRSTGKPLMSLELVEDEMRWFVGFFHTPVNTDDIVVALR